MAGIIKNSILVKHFKGLVISTILVLMFWKGFSILLTNCQLLRTRKRIRRKSLGKYLINICVHSPIP